MQLQPLNKSEKRHVKKKKKIIYIGKIQPQELVLQYKKKKNQVDMDMDMDMSELQKEQTTNEVNKILWFTFYLVLIINYLIIGF